MEGREDEKISGKKVERSSSEIIERERRRKRENTKRKNFNQS